MSISKLDPYHLYTESVSRNLTAEEQLYVDQLIRDFPYFALPRYLKARDVPEEGNIFSAAAYSVNRAQLKQYLKGNTLVYPVEERDTQTPLMADLSILPPTQSLVLRHYAPLFIWEFAPVASDQIATDSLFHPPVITPPLPAYAQLNSAVALRSLRYQGLTSRIKEEIKAYAPTLQQTKSATSESAQQVAKKSSSASLIDRFLKQKTHKRTKAVPNQGQQDKVAPHVQASIETDEEIASETLAKLHLRQNNKVEAIRMYEKLRLRFPEKSTYFDAQIKKINLS